MNSGTVLGVMCLCAMSVGACTDAFGRGTPAKGPYDATTLAQVEALYSLSEDAAITRLAKEYDAAVQARRIEEQGFPGYAGSWFDSTTQGLRVADSDAADFDEIKKLGAVPQLVSHNMEELEGVRNKLFELITSNIGTGSVQESYVDVQSNLIVLGIRDDVMTQASALVATARGDIPVQLNAVPANAIRFSTNLLGADGTQNATWISVYGGAWPCSIGATAEEVNGSTYTAGFATAGHCGTRLDNIESSGGTSLGKVCAAP